MREIVSDDGKKVVKSPWLRRLDAAAYCGVSSTFFDAHCGELPHGGDVRTRVYHVDVLDKWIKELKIDE